MLAPFVPADWLAAHRSEVVLADVRRPLPGGGAHERYDRGHLPGAVLVDLDRWLAAAPSAAHGRHPLPDPAVFAEGMSRAGIGDADTVVAYDDEDGVIAARLVWMLRTLGSPAALLDGRPRLDGVDEAAPVRALFTPRPWPAAALADLTDPGAGAGADAVVLDARTAERFRGADDPLDPRPGHVPGARNLPCRDSLDASGRLLPPDALRQRFAEVGVGPGTDVIAYCGSGVTACHDLLVLEQVGLGAGRLYPGSWSHYAADPERPVELGG